MIDTSRTREKIPAHRRVKPYNVKPGDVVVLMLRDRDGGVSPVERTVTEVHAGTIHIGGPVWFSFEGMVQQYSVSARGSVMVKQGPA